MATLKARRCAALPIALEQVGHQRPLRVGQVGVHATGAIGAAVSGGVAVASRRRALNRRALTGAAQRLEPLDTSLAQSLANRDGADLDASASQQLARHFVQRRARLLLRDRTQHRGVIGVQRGSAPGTSCLLNLRLRGHSRSPVSCLDKRIARNVIFVYTL